MAGRRTPSKKSAAGHRPRLHAYIGSGRGDSLWHINMAIALRRNLSWTAAATLDGVADTDGANGRSAGRNRQRDGNARRVSQGNWLDRWMRTVDEARAQPAPLCGSARHDGTCPRRAVPLRISGSRMRLKVTAILAPSRGLESTPQSIRARCTSDRRHSR